VKIPTDRTWRQRRREEKLAEVERAVADGSLTIRQATAEERERMKQERAAARKRLR
jgi:hypothetical protein